MIKDGSKKKTKPKPKVTTLKGVDSWTPHKKPKKRGSNGKRLKGYSAKGAKGIFSVILRSALENAKPVAGATATEMVVNTMSGKDTGASVVANALIYLAGGYFCAKAPKKMGNVVSIVNGAVIGSGKELLTGSAKKLGVTSLNGYQQLGGYQQLSGYEQLALDASEMAGYQSAAGALVPENVAYDEDGYIKMSGRKPKAVQKVLSSVL